MSDNVEAALCYGCRGCFPLRDMTQRLIPIDNRGRADTASVWLCDRCEVSIPDENVVDKKDLFWGGIFVVAAMVFFFVVILSVIYVLFETDFVLDGDTSEKVRYFRIFRLILRLISLGRKAVAGVFL